MKRFIFLILVILHQPLYADKIIKFMNVANSIPRMEMKPDANSQAWAKSARNILLLTAESIWESLYSANQANTQAGAALFCVAKQEDMNAEQMTDLIKDTYQHLSMSDDEKNQLSVAQVALIGLQQKYGCNSTGNRSQPFVQVRSKSPSLAQKMLHVAKTS